MTFDSCTALTEVTIPAGVGFLRHASFSNCFNLKKVVFSGDQPYTNGDPFYMCPEDLVVYCYSDADGWDDPLFYTYPVVKMDRNSIPDISTPTSDRNGAETGSGPEIKAPEPSVVPPDSGEQDSGREATGEIPTIGAQDAPVLSGDNGSDSGNATDSGVLPNIHGSEQKNIPSSVLIPVVIIGTIGVILFVGRKKK